MTTIPDWDRRVTREMARARSLSEEALRDRLGQLTGDGLDRAGRLTREEHAVVPTVPASARSAALDDVRAGDGSELREPKDPSLHPRFFSARSSCALAVNAFGFWRSDPSTLVVGAARDFQDLRFESKFPIDGAKGRIPPNVDVYAAGPCGHVAIESKLLEYLSPAKPFVLAEAYQGALVTLSHRSWRVRAEDLRENPTEFCSFGAAQIVKHYLGIKSARLSNARLIYLYWQPLDHANYPAFARHRQEIEVFSAGLTDPDVTFGALDYSTLLAEWAEAGTAATRSHVEAVRARYSVALDHQ